MPADQSEVIFGDPVSLSCLVGCSSEAVFTSSCGIRQSKLSCHAICNQGVGEFLWCTCVFVSLLKTERDVSHLGNPGVGIGQFIAFAIYYDTFYIIMELFFEFFIVGGDAIHS